MSTAAMTKRIAEAPRRSMGSEKSSRSRFIGAYYVITILTGAVLLFFHGRLAFAADLIASAFYLVITAVFWMTHSHDERPRAGVR